MSPQDEPDAALRAANLALTGKRREVATRFASIELRAPDPATAAWETAAGASVAVASVLLVLGVWFF